MSSPYPIAAIWGKGLSEGAKTPDRSDDDCPEYWGEEGRDPSPGAIKKIRQHTQNLNSS